MESWTGNHKIDILSKIEKLLIVLGMVTNANVGKQVMKT